MYEFQLPNLGEGIDKGVISAILVKVGDTVEVDTPLVEVESNKAILAVPSPVAGKVVEILVQEGDEVAIGQTILKLEPLSEGETPPSTVADMETPSTVSPEEEQAAPEKSAAPVPVAEPTTSPSQPAPAPSPPVAPAPPPAPPALEGSSPSGGQPTPPDYALIPAGPTTRRLARELGVDLRAVWQSKGKKGRVTPEDVKAFVRQGQQQVKPQREAPPFSLPDFSKFGPIHRERLSFLRKVISERLSYSWRTIPHVHQFHEADVSELLLFHQKYGREFKEKGSTTTLTVFILKALAQAVREYPQFAASLDEVNEELIYKHYCHIGVAVDTPEGLIVPVIRNVDQLSIFEIGKQLRQLAEKARNRKVTPEELSGACITLSNLGGIGGSFFTPIINPPEVAILGVGRTYAKPVWQDGQWQMRQYVPLCLGYDHRVIDGADGARFITYLVEILENFERFLLGG